MASSSSPSRSSYSSSLPVMALRDKIVEKIQSNRVTLIVGDTGCGKSSQVPQFLLEENMEPILCTQPRRFAVVAIARMVAEARKCEVGDEIGYHIGHLKSTSTRSKIVFKTAGVLLEEMLDKGLAALRYNVIILDEVHERSVESDLVLACVKQFMLRNKDLRVVLMSATADLKRYKDYFKDLGRDERVEVLAIPSSGQKTIFQRKVFYLEQVIELLGKNPESLSELYCSGTSPESADADIKPEVHTLIHDLVLHIHENEADIEKSILIFLPTYHSLEQQWVLLSPLNSLFKIHILHSSVDTEQALKAMQVWKSHRKVILATNIAESSVTIPGVAFVIDSCRSLQVFWDSNRKNNSSELTWVSKSQAEQRKGRTGRTCDGQIYRLVTRSFKFHEHEFPAILRLSLRQQVLLICCAEPKSINDPKVLLQKVLDPPDPEVVEDALSLLVHVHALEKPASHRGRYEPTFYGRLLASLPLSFDASVIILKFGEIGLLREGILIGVLMDSQPLPILHPFGQQILFTKFIDSYFEGNCDGKVLIGKKEMIYLGNLCAYQFWQRVFKDKHRVERLKQVVKVDESKATQTLISKLEEEWCFFHNLVQTSLNHVSEIYEDILNAVHRFRPQFFVTTNALPLYYDPYEFKHTCLLQSRLTEDRDALFVGHDHLDRDIGTRSCVALPFVASKDFQSNVLAGKLSTIIKEIRLQYTEDTSESPCQTANSIVSQVIGGASLCKFFMNGLCNKGSQCLFSHSYEARRPICKFFLTLQGCRYGDSCSFSHDYGPSISPFDGPHFCLPEDGAAEPASLLRLLPATAEEGYVLLLDDTDLHFSINLSLHCDPSMMIASTSQPYSSISYILRGDVKILWGVSHLYDPIIGMEQVSIPWTKVQCVLWFAEFSDNSDDVDGQSRLLKNFFEFLAVRILAETLYDMRVILTMNNIRFSQLQVEKLGRECFFFLSESFPFDESSFGKFGDRTTTKKPMTVSRPITYVFYLHPPTDIQFGDYSAALHKGLYKLKSPVKKHNEFSV